MNVSIFYSWQSDRPGEFCHYLIRDAANQAIKDVGVANELELQPRLDHDTRGKAGMPEIADTILQKIRQAGFFLADVTFVAMTNDGKLIPNPNVVLELGYAARAIGWERIICVMNEEYGKRENQMFNIQHRRLPIGYTLNSREQTEVVKFELAGKIKYALKSLLLAEHNGVEDTLSKLDAYCLMFLKRYANENIIYPPATNSVVLGAQLDTLGFNRAVDRLLDLRIIHCRIEEATGTFVYEWTYLGLLLLKHLGWRMAGKLDSFLGIDTS